jgi:hypothetical protein
MRAMVRLQLGPEQQESRMLAACSQAVRSELTVVVRRMEDIEGRQAATEAATNAQRQHIASLETQLRSSESALKALEARCEGLDRVEARKAIVVRGISVPSTSPVADGVRLLIDQAAAAANVPSSPSRFILTAHPLRGGTPALMLVKTACADHAAQIFNLRNFLPHGVTLSKGTTVNERTVRRAQQPLFKQLQDQGHNPFYRGSTLYYRTRDGASMGPVVLGDSATYPASMTAMNIDPPPPGRQRQRSPPQQPSPDHQRPRHEGPSSRPGPSTTSVRAVNPAPRASQPPNPNAGPSSSRQRAGAPGPANHSRAEQLAATSAPHVANSSNSAQPPLAASASYSVVAQRRTVDTLIENPVAMPAHEEPLMICPPPSAPGSSASGPGHPTHGQQQLLLPAH